MVMAFPLMKSSLNSGVKEKQRCIAIQGDKTHFIDTTAVGERLRYNTEPNTTKIRGGRLSKHWIVLKEKY